MCLFDIARWVGDCWQKMRGIFHKSDFMQTVSLLMLISLFLCVFACVCECEREGAGGKCERE